MQRGCAIHRVSFDKGVLPYSWISEMIEYTGGSDVVYYHNSGNENYPHPAQIPGLVSQRQTKVNYAQWFIPNGFSKVF